MIARTASGRSSAAFSDIRTALLAVELSYNISQTVSRDALVVGGGVASFTTATPLVRADPDTLVVDDGESAVRRNIHLENILGFPADVNSRLFTDPPSKQVGRNDVGRLTDRVADLGVLGNDKDSLFWAIVETDGGEETVEVSQVVTASRPDASYLEDMGVDLRAAGPKTYVGMDGLGRVSVPGVYTVGQLTEIYHQVVVTVGDTVETTIMLVHDSRMTFYNGRVTPTGYFTDHNREVPPVCKEIDADERVHRKREPREVIRRLSAEPHDEP